MHTGGANNHGQGLLTSGYYPIRLQWLPNDPFILKVKYCAHKVLLIVLHFTTFFVYLDCLTYSSTNTA